MNKTAAVSVEDLTFIFQCPVRSRGLQFIIIRRKFKIYISAISSERGETLPNEGDNPLPGMPSLKTKRESRKRWNIFYFFYVGPHLYIYIGIPALIRGRSLFTLSICVTLSYRRISLLIITKSFFFFNHLPYYPVFMQLVRPRKCISNWQGKNILFMYIYEYIISPGESEGGKLLI